RPTILSSLLSRPAPARPLVSRSRSAARETVGNWRACSAKRLLIGSRTRLRAFSPALPASLRSRRARDGSVFRQSLVPVLARALTAYVLDERAEIRDVFRCGPAAPAEPARAEVDPAPRRVEVRRAVGAAARFEPPAQHRVGGPDP